MVHKKCAQGCVCVCVCVCACVVVGEGVGVVGTAIIFIVSLIQLRWFYI